MATVHGEVSRPGDVISAHTARLVSARDVPDQRRRLAEVRVFVELDVTGHRRFTSLNGNAVTCSI